jgi:hypothetical protein
MAPRLCLLLAAGAAGLVLAQQGAPQRLARVSGRVVRNPTGEPLRRASVTLRSPDGEWQRALTDAQGNFTIDQVRPGEYRLDAERAGYLRQEYGAGGPAYRGTTLTVAGRDVTGLEFRLTPQGVLTGRVVDEEGEPVNGAEVTALRLVGFGTPRALRRIRGGATDDRGEFRIPALNPGSYYLVAEPPDLLLGGAREVEYAPSFFPGSNDAAGAVPILVGAGQEVPAVIQLRKTRVFRVSGRVVDAGGGTIPAGVQLSLVPKDPALALMALAPPSALTAEGGSFLIEDVPPGAYYLTAFYAQGRLRISARVPLDVSGRDVEGAILTAGAGVQVKGRLRTESPAALKGATLSLVPAEGPALAGWTAAVSEDGAFQLENVPRDRFLFEFSGLPESHYVKSARSGGQDVLDGLDLGRFTGGVELEVLLAPNAGAIEAQVTDDGKPVAGASVVLSPEPLGPPRPFLHRTAQTDSMGRVRVGGLAPGDYRLYAYEEEAGAVSGLPFWLLRPPVEAVKVSVVEGDVQAAPLKLLKTETR